MSILAQIGGAAWPHAACAAVALAALCASAASEPGRQSALLPPGRAAWPSCDELANGPLRRRLLKGTKSPTLSHYAVASGQSRANLIAYARRTGIGGSWLVMGGAGRAAYDEYMATGWPVIVSQFVVPVNEARMDNDPTHAELVRSSLAEAPGFLTFLMAEWENYVYAWWMEVDPRPMLGKTDAELRQMDRRGVYQAVLSALREWKRRAGGHLSLMTGHGLHSHTAEIGLDAIGIETSENIAATQVKRAYCRGAARQFGIPWIESVSAWFGPSVTAPDPEPKTYDVWPGVTVGGSAGHSLSHMERVWYTSWFSGAADINPETSTSLLFEDQWDLSTFAREPRLSRFGVAADRFCRHMRSTDIGVPFTPFGVIVGREHGRWTNWGRPWGRFDPTLGDTMTGRFFDQIFPGQSLGPGDEEHYLCPSPYGDTFDVLVNDADRTAWGAYRALVAVGDVPWTPDDIRYLADYARRGGVLVLNEVNIGGWDRALIGLAPDGFRSARGCRIVMTHRDGSPALLRRRLGKGWVFVASASPVDGQPQAVPDALLAALAQRFLPCSVTGGVETLINRTQDGWMLLLVNNGGIRKTPKERETIDPKGTADVRVRFAGGRPRVRELLSGAEFRLSREPSARAWDISLPIPPGEIRMLEVTR